MVEHEYLMNAFGDLKEALKQNNHKLDCLYEMYLQTDKKLDEQHRQIQKQLDQYIVQVAINKEDVKDIQEDVKTIFGRFWGIVAGGISCVVIWGIHKLIS